jgi:hypothetical protein
MAHVTVAHNTAVFVHTRKAKWGEETITQLIWVLDGVKGHVHGLVHFPLGKALEYPTNRRLGGTQSWWARFGGNKCIASVGNQTTIPGVFSPIESDTGLFLEVCF